MTDDDVTRMMEVPSDLLAESEAKGRWGEQLGAKTPCVGVASMGNTHFGETQFGDEPSIVVGRDAPSASPSEEGTASTNPRAALKPSSTAISARKRGDFARVPRWLSAPKSLSRPVALSLGVLLGVGAWFFFSGLGSEKAKQATPLPDATTQVRVLVHQAAGEKEKEALGIGDVAVRVAQHVVVTDEDGVAEFSSVPADGAVTVQAACPDGYSGAPLERRFTQAILRSSKSWFLDLACQANFFSVELEVRVKGCGEMKVLIDGGEVGATAGGTLHINRRSFKETAALVNVVPLQGDCTIDGARTVALTRDEPQILLDFEGKRPRAPRSWRPRVEPKHRPYRL